MQTENNFMVALKFFTLLIPTANLTGHPVYLATLKIIMLRGGKSCPLLVQFYYFTNVV